jgi:hypothetical protein
MRINSSDPNIPFWEFMIFDGKNPRTIASTSPVKWNRRTHIAVSLDAGKGSFFVDGQRQGEFVWEKPYHRSATPFLIGACPQRQGNGSDYETKQHFHGVIEEIRISKSICYPADFKPASRLSSAADTILLYHLDEAKDDIVGDASGNRRHGFVKGGTTWN